jgi:hypothetical protein
VGPAGFGPATNRYLSARSVYEPGALTGLSYGPVGFVVSLLMLFLTKFKRFLLFKLLMAM